MNKRALCVTIATLLAALATSSAVAKAARPPRETQPYFQPIREVQANLRAGRVTSVELTRDFLQRIAKLDRHGPRLDAVIQLNPDAMKIARARDRSRAAGKAHGPLFGIPFLIKANMDTADRMPTTAGSLAMMGPPASRDATVVAKLRRAGAILVGKTNLSEWANFRSSHSTSGWSGRGGLTRNPYVLDRNPCGSSSGSAVAVAAGLIPLSLGTETDGSLTCPASANGIVTIKPTLGLVSRAGIVPISHSQDDPGPMARSVAGAAGVLTVIAGSDPRDPATANADKHATDYSKFLKPGGLRGKRIGFVCALAGSSPAVHRVLARSAAALEARGASVEPVKLPHLGDYGKAEMTVLLYEFKHDLDAYLETRKGLEVKTLADVIAFDKRHVAEEMPWFGQDLFIKAETKGPLTDKAYREALAREKHLAGPKGIDAALAAHNLDALMAPAGGPAWTTDLVNGDHTGAGGDHPAAVAGYPSITVPAGNVHGLPVGVTFFTGKWREPTLIAIAYGFEQATKARIRPRFLAHAPRPATVPTLARQEGAAPAATTTVAALCAQSSP